MSLPNPPSDFRVLVDNGSKYLNFTSPPDAIRTRIKIFGQTGVIFDNVTTTNRILIPDSITGEHDTVGMTENSEGWGEENKPPKKVMY